MRPRRDAPVMSQAEVEHVLRHGGSLAHRRIGTLKLANQTILPWADFTGAVIDEAIFENVTFSSGAWFLDAVFLGDAAFRHCVLGATTFRAARFRGKADFTLASFDSADFWRALFRGAARFASAQVKAQDGNLRRFIPAGEANFSFAGFDADVDFTDMKFHGENYFVGSRFASNATFDHAKFFGPVVFENQENRTCVVRNDVQDLVEADWPNMTPDDVALCNQRYQLLDRKRGLFTELVRAQILKRSFEQAGPEGDPEKTMWAEYAGDRTTEEVLELAKNSPLGSELADLFECLRKPLTGPIFPGSRDTHVFFGRVTFSAQDAPHFKSANLGSCLFSGTRLEHLRFETVKWAEHDLPHGRRPALADERFAKSPEDLDRVRSQYRQLAASYEAAHDQVRAKQFNEAASEIERLLFPNVDVASALAVWRRKLDFLQVELARESDAKNKFAIMEQIDEARIKIQELS